MTMNMVIKILIQDFDQEAVVEEGELGNPLEQLLPTLV